MDDMTPFEERFASRLRADAARGVAGGLSSVAMADEALRAGRHSRFASWIVPSQGARRWVLAGLTAGLIVLALLAAILVASRPPRSFPSNLIAYSDNAT